MCAATVLLLLNTLLHVFVCLLIFGKKQGCDMVHAHGGPRTTGGIRTLLPSLSYLISLKPSSHDLEFDETVLWKEKVSWIYAIYRV